MSKVSEALKHPFLMALVPAVIGVGSTVYSSDKDKNKTVDEPEKIYWQSIQPPNDSAEKYCSYLEKYPQGHFVELAQTQCPSATEVAEQATDAAEEATAEIDEAEKIYWQSIQPPNESDEKYCSYLKQYPQGHFVELAKTQCSTAVEAQEKAAEVADQKEAAASTAQ